MKEFLLSKDGSLKRMIGRHCYHFELLKKEVQLICLVFDTIEQIRCANGKLWEEPVYYPDVKLLVNGLRLAIDRYGLAILKCAMTQQQAFGLMAMIGVAMSIETYWWRQQSLKRLEEGTTEVLAVLSDLHCKINLSIRAQVPGAVKA